MTPTIAIVSLPPGIESFLREQWGEKYHFRPISSPLDLCRQLGDENSKFDAIITHDKLPPMSVADLVRTIRDFRGTAETPVAIFTDNSDGVDTEACDGSASSFVIQPQTPKSQVIAWFDSVVAASKPQAPSLDQNMATAITTATNTVMQVVLGMKIVENKLEIGASKLRTAELIASVSVSGFVTGGVTLFTDMRFAKIVAARMLGQDPGESISESEIVDAVGELVNMIAGKIKVNLCMQEDVFFMSAPSVVLGKEVRRVPMDKNVAFGMPCSWNEHGFLVELSLVPNKSPERHLAPL